MSDETRNPKENAREGERWERFNWREGEDSWGLSITEVES